MTSKNDYSGIGIGSPCQFTTLGEYYPYTAGNMQPVAPGRAMLTSRFYTVPTYTTLKGQYNALVDPHNMGSGCNGYRSIYSAYGKMPCPYKYQLSLCSSANTNYPTHPYLSSHPAYDN
tara:strand:+ start:1062 stop:1415 length:354 start_codon:yes stop_codon:yes gene_type:complete